MAVDDDTEGSGDYKAWEAKFRCTNLKSTKKHSVGKYNLQNQYQQKIVLISVVFMQERLQQMCAGLN